MRRTVPLATAALAALLLAACDNPTEIRGFSPSPGAVDKLEVKTQSREDVQRLIGTPSSVATFNPNVWYYISQQQETFAFLKPAIVEQHVLQLTFNDAGRLTTLKSYDLKDGQDIDMVSRVTPTAGKELTILEQLLGNVGKFSGPRQDANPGAPTGGGI
jgi:outer membrane protein assembly factor BamE (lipoprotein component of BamABCDE complex)